MPFPFFALHIGFVSVFTIYSPPILASFSSTRNASEHLQLIANTTNDFICTPWVKPTYFGSSRVKQKLPGTCAVLKKELCWSQTRYWGYRCSVSNSTGIDYATLIKATSTYVNDRLTPCRGSHEVLTLAQVEEQHPNKSVVTQRAVDTINQLGIVIALAGAPGAGKSTISALGAHYGMVGVDLEDLPGQRDSSIPIEHPLYHWHADTKELRVRGLSEVIKRNTMTNSGESGTVRHDQRSGSPLASQSFIVGLAAYHSLKVYHPYIASTISVLLKPSPLKYKRRFESRSKLVGGDLQHPGLGGFELENEADIIMHTDGCPEQDLRDICLAVVWWLFHAAASSVEHQAMQLRFRKMVTQGNIKVERISRLNDELRISERLADHQVRWL